MSFDVLNKKVQDRAKELAQEQIKLKEEELQVLQQESTSRLTLFEDIQHTLLEKEKYSLDISITGASKSQATTLLHEAKQQVFERITSSAMDYFSSLSIKEKSTLFSHFYTKATEVISVDLVYVRKEDVVVVESFLPKGVLIEVDSTLGEGIVFESTASKQRVDMRISSLLDSVMEEREDEIHKILGE